MKLLDTPHPALRATLSRHTGRGFSYHICDILSYAKEFYTNVRKKLVIKNPSSRVTGEGGLELCSRSGEGFLKILRNLKAYLRFVCFTGIVVLMNISSILKAEQGVAAPSSSFFERKSEGWHWYQDPPRDEKAEEKDKPSYSLSPTQQIETQRKALETKLHTAIITPTKENLIAYITAQKALMDQSQKFAEVWKRVVLTTPSLDETLTHPVDQNARHLYYAAHHQRVEKQIKKLASEYGLFFFFRKNCAYCHHFAPIVKRFAQKYGWSILPVSLDGGTLPEFPKAKQNNGITERLNITHVPALIALHPKTGQLIPLAYGLVSESEIEQRVELLTRLSEKSIQGDSK